MSDRTNAREYFRSLEHMAGSPEVAERLANEFPSYDPKEIAALPRRSFLKLMGASMAVAGVTLTGCRRWPKEHLVPTTAGLRDQMPGIPEIYATAIERNGVAESVIVTSYDGRPIKVEGNPLHPLFTTWRKADGSPLLGGSTVLAQASVLELYDPVRTRAVINNENNQQSRKTWDDFFAAFDAAVAAHGPGGVAVLSESTSSLSFAGLKGQFLKKYPGATWAEYEPISRDEEAAAGKAAFNGANGTVRAVYNLANANTIVSLDGDLLGVHPNNIRHANDWSQKRRTVDKENGRSMNRLYIAESCFSITGASADHRLPLRPSQLAGVTMAIAAAFIPGVVRPTDLTDAQNKWVDAAVADLKAAGANGLVTVGLQAPARVQALAYAINYGLKSVGTTVTFHETGSAGSQVDSLRALNQKMANGEVGALLILGGNPVYDAPGDLLFAKNLANVGFRAHLSLFADETSRKCNWHLPRSHYLESWGDARAWDGSVCLQQPLILPLYDTKSPIELLASLIKDNQPTDGQSLLRRWMSASLQATADETGWQRSLHDGFVANSAFPAAKLNAPQSISGGGTPQVNDFELRFQQSLSTFDGRYANNAWLIECPDSITKLVWDNAALLNKKDADKLGVGTGDMIEIKNGDAKVVVPVLVLWGQPQGVIGLTVGYGRTAAGPVGGDPSDSFGTQPVGVDVYPIRRSDGMSSVLGVTVTKTGDSYELVSTQDFQPLDWAGMKGYEDRVGNKGQNGRIVRDATFAAYNAGPKQAIQGAFERVPLQQLWDSPYGKPRPEDPDAPQAFNNPHAWGMSIDMNTCIGCNACVVACQSENNIPTVGKAMVKMNREMYWLRIDRYLKPKVDENRDPVDYENVDIVFQPMMCVHCENAPCEQVCPVAATMHDTEGLNVMVYNRCIGTRYCANNCPYKVRRFNYLDWHSRNPRNGDGLGLLGSAWLGIPDTQQNETIRQVKRMVYNPDVTVRMRGVMEKCTYCTQRIKAATIKRKNDFARGDLGTGNKPNGQPVYTVDDLQVITACQQACPTQAITFGNLLDKTSVVREHHALPRAYAVLEDFNTRPRTRHMAKIRNENESLADNAPAAKPAEA